MSSKFCLKREPFKTAGLNVLKTLLVAKLISVVLNFLLPSILIFQPLLLFSFPFLSSSFPSSFLMFFSVFKYIATSIVMFCVEHYEMPFLSHIKGMKVVKACGSDGLAPFSSLMLVEMVFQTALCEAAISCFL